LEVRNYIDQYLKEVNEITAKINKDDIEKMVNVILKVKNDEGRIFMLGVGGSAGNASHAVNDFRKIAGIECYTPTDNVSELKSMK